MDKVSIIGLDISKRSFQVHGATAHGAPVLRRKLARAKVFGVPRVAAGVSGGDGGVRGRASLGAGDSTARPRGPVDRADVRQGVREAPQERCARRGGDRGGGSATARENDNVSTNASRSRRVPPTHTPGNDAQSAWAPGRGLDTTSSPTRQRRIRPADIALHRTKTRRVVVLGNQPPVKRRNVARGLLPARRHVRLDCFVEPGRDPGETSAGVLSAGERPVDGRRSACANTARHDRPQPWTTGALLIPTQRTRATRRASNSAGDR